MQPTAIFAGKRKPGREGNIA